MSATSSDTNNEPVVVVYSGGLDSTVLLAHLIHEGNQVFALTLDYGQRHRREIEAAKQICAHYRGRGVSDAGGRLVEHRIADLSSLQVLLGGSSLTQADVAVPKGHYTEDSMKATVVPNRNMILLSVAAGWAVALKASAVAYAAHGGDHAIYPDCREAFAEAMDTAFGLADWHPLRLARPFVGWTKADIVRRGHALDVPLALTWSCYEGGARHCGACGTCIERREAFHLAGIPDPTEYASEAPTTAALVDAGWRL
ncbi:MAG: 7-cyano-7-deazaguanine synthase QueC [Opitutales bacterium]